ncbi:MAG: efflux RND transporter periplasmic adaptor subunit [Flavobacteriales bacterium]|nr:efflux RND transporter periplasmic adaptor subunit [Flavobacteriales bacterium]
MKRKRLYTILGGGVLLLLILATVFGRGPETPRVETDTVARHRIVETVIASGRIQPEVEVKVSAEVSGQLIELPVREGDVVAAGDLLARINPDIFESRLSQAKAALDNALANEATSAARLAQSQAAFAAAELAYKRNQDLYTKGVLSQADFEQAEVSFRSAEADLEASQQSLRSAGFSIRSAEATVTEAEENLRRTVLRATQTGTVTALVKEEGEGVQGIGSFQGEVIMKISELGAMEVDVEVNESDIVKVALGDTARIEVDAYTERAFYGMVTEIGNTALNAAGSARLSLESVTNFSVKIRILPESYADLKTGRDSTWTPFRPGMSATVEIETEVKDNILAVPIKAVTTRPDTSGDSGAPSALCVFLLKEGQAERHDITTGIQDNAVIELLSDLPEGATVITGPYDLLSRRLEDGDPVQSQEEAAADGNGRSISVSFSTQ